MIRELYEASLAGVLIVLNVRGLCCLRAGVPGLSPTIRVYSTLGRFLEHSRIYRFENGGAAELFIGSADLMTRPLSRRMEVVAPVCDPVIKAELEDILRTYEQDNCSAWDMQPDGEYVRRHPAPDEAPRSAQRVFIEHATLVATPNGAGAAAALPGKTATSVGQARRAHRTPTAARASRSHWRSGLLAGRFSLPSPPLSVPAR